MGIPKTELVKFGALAPAKRISPASTNPIAQTPSSYKSNIARLGTGELSCKVDDWCNAHELLGVPKYNDIVIA